MECAAIGVPDKRLGELVAAVVVPKEASKGGKVTEQELIEFVKPRYGFLLFDIMMHCVSSNLI